MNLQGLGSGFEFNGLTPKEKLAVMDRYLFPGNTHCFPGLAGAVIESQRRLGGGVERRVDLWPGRVLLGGSVADVFHLFERALARLFAA